MPLCQAELEFEGRKIEACEAPSFDFVWIDMPHGIVKRYVCEDCMTEHELEPGQLTTHALRTRVS